MSVRWEVRKRILDMVSSGRPLFHEFPPPARRDLIYGLESEYGVGQTRDGEPDIDVAKIWRILWNGGRTYRDCDHVEYCTGEEACPLRATVSYEAGKVLCWAARFSPWLDNYSRDGKGSTFGVHENYARYAPRDQWHLMVPYLVARVVFDGAGCVVLDNGLEYVSDRYSYDLSQRADYMVAAIGGDTPSRRVLMTDRKESHMTIHGCDRMHIICGDPHMSPVNMFMKVGMTGMMGELLDMGVLPKVNYNLDCAVMDMQALSRSIRNWDPATAGARWFMQGITSGSKSVLELLSRYLRAAEAHFAGRDIVTDTLLALLEDTFQKLGRNPWELRKRLDWVAKLDILNTFRAADGSDPRIGERLRSSDIEYHLFGTYEADGVTTRRGLYTFLDESGQIEPLFDGSLLKHTMLEPSPYTRAFFRGRVVQMVEGEFSRNWRVEHVNNECWKILNFSHVHRSRQNFTVVTGNPFRTYSEWLPRVRSMFAGGTLENIIG